MESNCSNNHSTDNLSLHSIFKAMSVWIKTRAHTHTCKRSTYGLYYYYRIQWWCLLTGTDTQSDYCKQRRIMTRCVYRYLPFGITKPTRKWATVVEQVIVRQVSGVRMCLWFMRTTTTPMGLYCLFGILCVASDTTSIHKLRVSTSLFRCDEKFIRETIQFPFRPYNLLTN